MPAPTIRLLADDLTGALDSAAQFVPLAGPIPVRWTPANLPPTAALDTATREADAATAQAILRRHAGLLPSAAIAFKKIDSLLRGPVAAELAACLPLFDHCVLAPAFPFQGRITRNGRQLVRDGATWRDTGIDLPAELAACGLPVPLRDATTDADLDAIVAAGRSLPGRVLWCGTGGLAGALAGHQPVPCPPLPRPILALVGSDHGVSAAQLLAAGDCVHRLRPVDPLDLGPLDPGPLDPAPLDLAPLDLGPLDLTPLDPAPLDLAPLRRSLQAGAAAVCVVLPDGTPRAAATRHIGRRFADLLSALPRPGTLMVAGGETLRRLCDSLGVTGLDVDGECVPGVPTSRMRGGAWDGQRLVSKSGAFGDAGFLARLLSPRPLPGTSTDRTS